MKPRSLIILLIMALGWVLPASASRLGDIRFNARFLTDRMAYELRLSNRQYDDIFEINYDFFYNVDPYIDRMSYGDPYALDMYYRYLDERNDDIRWVLSRKRYVRFMSLEHFFLPIYAVNRVCYIRIYNIYPNRTHFYYGCPAHYYSYRGGHCRHHCGGISYYKTNYKKTYRHAVYNGKYQSVRTRTRERDFPNMNRHNLPGRGSVGSNSGIRESSRKDRVDEGFGRQPSRHVDRHSGTTVTRDKSGHSRRQRVVTDRNRTESSYVRPARYDGKRFESSSTRVHRSEGVSNRSSQRSENVGSRSHRSTVSRQTTTSKNNRSSEHAERSERRGARER